MEVWWWSHLGWEREDGAESTPVNERKALVDLEGEEVKWDDTF